MSDKEQIKIQFADVMTDEVKGDIIFEILKMYVNIFRPLLFFLAFLFVFDITCNVSDSMQPTIYENDVSIILKSRHTTLERGDIVSLDSPLDNSYYSKRIIGLPGEEISFEDGKVYIDSKLLEEDYTIGITRLELGFYDSSIIQVKEGHYFVMGDNREHSMDSRYFGDVAEESIKGKLFYLIPSSKIIKKPRRKYS